MAPIRPSAAQAADHRVERVRLPSGGDGRLATAMDDFLLEPDLRLTEQERASMTAMLLTLVETIADEIRVRLPDPLAEESDVAGSELLARLRRSGLLRHESLVGLLLRRANEAQSLQRPNLAASPLQDWTRDEVPSIAAAAMAVVLARAASRDRFGRPGLELGDCDAETAVSLSFGVAAALAGQVPEAEEAVVGATVDLLGRHDEGQRLHALEARLVIALEGAQRLTGDLLVGLAASGELGLLAHALGRLGGIAGNLAWDLLFSPQAGGLALLLRIADQPRTVAARLIALLALGRSRVDAEAEIMAFDQFTVAAVAAQRDRLRHPPAFATARSALEHG